MYFRFLAITLLVAGCSAAADTTASDDAPAEQAAGSVAADEPVRLTPGPERFGADLGVDQTLEADFARHMRSPLLLTYEMPADGMKVVLNREIALMQRMTERYTNQSESEPQTRPLAAFRLAQLNTRLACSLAGAPPPNQLAKEQRHVYESYIAEHGYALLKKNGVFVAQVPQENALREPMEILANVPGGAGIGGLRTYCTKSEIYWHHRNNELAVDDVEAARCEEGDAVACWAWAEYGSGGEAAEVRACELGAMLACPATEAEPKRDGVFGIMGTGD